MKTSEKISELNYQRFKNWNAKFDLNNSKQSIFVFKGDVYIGLDTNTLSEEDLKFSQQNLRILSGLYGILRPLDLMMPYRLEMGAKLKNKIGKNLYDFWGDDITENLNNTLSKHNDKTLVNLASNEYFKAVQQKNLDGRLITPEFKDWKNGKYKMISFFAKKARGLMVRYAIDHKLQEPEELQNFDYDGYNYNPELSQADRWVFCRG